MKQKIIALLCMIVMMVISMSGCYGCGNSKIFDTHWTFNYAVINGTHVIKVKNWTDCSNGQQVQVTSNQGITYCVGVNSIILMDGLDSYYSALFEESQR